MFFNDSDFVKAAMSFGTFCAVAGAVIFAVFVFVIPWLWGMVKPWVHVVTG